MIKKALEIFSYMTLAAAFFVLMFFFLSNHKLWFNYISVEPAQESFSVGEPLVMISYMERKTKKLTLEYYDLLRCQNAGRLKPVIDKGVYESKQPLTQIKWVYLGTVQEYNLPSKPDTCVMEATITFKVFGVINASQNVISSSFSIE